MNRHFDQYASEYSTNSIVKINVFLSILSTGKTRLIKIANFHVTHDTTFACHFSQHFQHLSHI